MTKVIDSLNWRYATKSFDISKKVSNKDLDEIIEAFRLTASSFGLEPWKLIIVENDKIKQELVENSYGQKQVGECSHLLVFTRQKNINDDYIDSFLNNTSKITGTKRDDLNGYQDVIEGFFSRMDDKGKQTWAEQQVFIALGNVMNVLAIKEIDSCAIGGFNSEGYDKILSLDEKGLASVVILPIGYRSSEDKYSSIPKVRFSKKDIVEIIK